MECPYSVRGTDGTVRYSGQACQPHATPPRTAGRLIAGRFGGGFQEEDGRNGRRSSRWKRGRKKESGRPDLNRGPLGPEPSAGIFPVVSLGASWCLLLSPGTTLRQSDFWRCVSWCSLLPLGTACSSIRTVSGNPAGVMRVAAARTEGTEIQEAKCICR